MGRLGGHGGLAGVAAPLAGAACSRFVDLVHGKAAEAGEAIYLVSASAAAKA